ncbi:LysR family transcriptional regulator [Dyadobacter sp. CY347]|uniref:LysR family transcriptional regulator n=1 Tax=Dyadobacter sp. CY347 TaxID=2909336 RepID=UPI001F3E128F|nr:LysR family transcriptional regulator [Dyadobacter sp. CY347]MCF2491630.1 LysR family transcriptional regulator [Dyadobacter sp. CY347]
MNYTLNQLRIFVAVVKAQSVTKASEELHLSQPAVSIQLRNFEAQFDIPLTEVIGRKIYITDFGREIATAAENIIEQVYAINYKTMAYKGQLAGKLKISVVSTGKYVMPFFLSEFLSQHAGIELIMDVTNKNMVLESLENNEVDFALVSILPTTINIDWLDLLPNRLFLVGKATQKVKDKDGLDGQFQTLPLIFREKGSGTRLAMERFISAQNVSVVKKMELTSNEAVKQAILAGLGYSIMPLIGIRNELSSHQLEIIDVPGLPIETTWSMVWLKEKKQSQASLSFLEFVKKQKSTIIKQHFSWCEPYQN